MKICNKCKQEKSLESFYKNRSRKDGLSRMCKKCKTEHEHLVIKKAKEWWDKWKSDKGCSKCGDTRPYVLDLHHLDPTQKEFTIGKVLGSGTSGLESRQRRILEEAKKCIVVCANCHREIHWLEKQK